MIAIDQTPTVFVLGFNSNIGREMVLRFVGVDLKAIRGISVK
jgi:hypothetical protein|tara:strand:+ start:149 stop:274 length:126 start_codon:yes stop_codon:yes gene_type:complete